MSVQYLDKTGLAYFWGKIKDYVDSHTGGGLSVDDIYPVGSIYMSANNVNPSTLFTGTTWTQIKGRFLLGSDDTKDWYGQDKYVVGDTGGEETHTLTTDEMPSHTHTFTRGGNSLNIGTTSAETTAGFTSASSGGLWANTNKYRSAINSTGGGSAHNNMPPYLVVSIWQRTA